MKTYLWQLLMLAALVATILVAGAPHGTGG